eukprot:364314-Chlamydomonas_euryale.AAC.15
MQKGEGTKYGALSQVIGVLPALIIAASTGVSDIPTQTFGSWVYAACGAPTAVTQDQLPLHVDWVPYKQRGRLLARARSARARGKHGVQVD